MVQLEAATYLASQERWLDARKQCRTITRNHPKFLPAWELRAKLSWHLGDLEDVVRTTRTLMRLNPHEPGYMLLLGMAHSNRGRHAEAVRVFQRALQMKAEPQFQKQVLAAMKQAEIEQTDTVIKLTSEDDSFRARFESDPVTACREQGFEFSWLAERKMAFEWRRAMEAEQTRRSPAQGRS